MAGLFISYARDDDAAFVERLHTDLVKRGFPVWWDRTAMDSRGRTFLQELRDAIAQADRVLLIVGPRAVESDYVNAEWLYAMEACRVVVPVLRLGSPALVPGQLVSADDFKLVPRELSTFHCPDFRDGAKRPYKQAFEDLVRILRAPVPPLADLHGVDALPAHYLARSLATAKLDELVLSDIRSPEIAGPGERVVAVHGMAGAGKSVIGAAFARSCAARRSFGDGIVWLRLGPRANPARRLADLGAAFQDDPAHYTDIGTASARLAGLLDGRNCLVVLDDVWQVADAEPFVNALGAATRGRVLLTTRDRAIATALGARELPLDVFDEQQALALLAGWADEEAASLPPEAHQVAAQCGFLPLALAMTGAMARGRPERWRNALHRLRCADLARLRRDFPNYPYPDLLRAIEVSVDALPEETRTRYLELAVFPEREPIPEAALTTYFGLDGFDTQDFCDLLIDRSLAKRVAGDRLLLHDLQHDFVRARRREVTDLHARLVDAYRSHCTHGWPTGPDDGYFFDHLAHHLEASGRRAELLALIERPWMEAQFRRTRSHSAFAADVRQAIEAAGKDPIDIAEVVRGALIYATLGSVSSAAPTGVLAALAVSDRLDEVLGHVGLVHDATRQNEAYVAVAGALLEQGRRDEAKAVLLRALTAARLVGEQRGTGGSWGHVLQGLGQFDLMQELGVGLGEVSKANLFITIAHKMVSLDADVAVAITNDLATPMARDKVRECVVETLIAAEDITRAATLAAAAEDTDCRSALLARVAVAQALSGEFDTALEMAEAAGALDSVVRALAENKRFDEAVPLLERLPEDAARTARLHLADAIARSGDFPSAYEIAGSDLDLVDAVTRIMVVLAAHTDDCQLAWEAADGIADMECRLLALGDAAQSLVKRGENVRAVGFAEGIVARAPEIESHASALALASEVLKDAGEVERAVEVSRAALAAAPPDNLPVLDALRSQLGQALIANGQIDAALALAAEIATELPKATVLLAAVHALFAAHRPADALVAARAISHQRARSLGLQIAARELLESGDHVAAANTARAALAEALSVEDEDERLDAVLQTAAPLAQAADTDGLLAVYRSLVQAAGDPVATAVIGHVLAEATNDLESVLAPLTALPRREFGLSVLDWLARLTTNAGDTRAVAERALDLASVVSAGDARLEAIIAFAESLRGTSMAQEGLALFARAWELVDLSREDEDISDSLARIVVLLATVGRLELALEYVEPLDEAARARALASMLAADAKPLQLFSGPIDSIEDPAARALVLAARADRSAREGAPEQARADAAASLAAAESVIGPGRLIALAGAIASPADRARALAGLASAFAQREQADRAADIAQHALAAADGVVDRAERAQSFAAIAAALTHSGKQDEAIATLHRALDAARQSDRRTILEVLASATPTLCALDDGQTLHRVGEAVLCVERWWQR